MKIFIVCPVRYASKTCRKRLEDYVAKLESEGHIVHLPHRDTEQDQTLICICFDNIKAIKSSDEVHVFYSPRSLGTHFDLGVTIALGKKLVVVEQDPSGKGDVWCNMLDTYSHKHRRRG
jgi:hypothetical protein